LGWQNPFSTTNATSGCYDKHAQITSSSSTCASRTGHTASVSFVFLFCLFSCSDLLGRVPSHFADDVHSNLHGKVPKTAVEKMLQTMADEGKISVKVNGKQKIFVARQVLCSTRMQA